MRRTTCKLHLSPRNPLEDPQKESVEMIKVDKKDLEELLNRLEQGAAEEVIQTGMNQLAEYGIGIAKKNTPRVTTNLMNNWSVSEVSAKKLVLINNTEYAEYVEYGHRQQPGRYVPAIGKRLKRAWVRGVFYAARSEEQLRNNAGRILKPIITKELERILNG